MSTDAILTADNCIFDNLIGFFRTIATGYEIIGDSHAIFSDIANPINNICLVPEAVNLTAATVDKIISRYKDTDIDDFCIFKAGDTGEIDTILIDKHFTKIDSFAGMLKMLDSAAAYSITLPAATEIVAVSNESQLQEWLLPFKTAFGYSDAAANTLVKYFLQELNNPDIKHYVAYHDQKPVGCASIFIRGKVAGLYNLGVLPEFRQQGIGLQLQKTRLNVAISRYCEKALMQAAAISEIMAIKLGFQKKTYFTPYLLNFKKK